jgi:MFS family permease
VALVLLGSFVSHERRTPHALLPMDLLRSRIRAGAVIVMALFVGAQFAFFFFTVQFMQGVLGYGALRSGFAFLPLTLLIFATSRISPRLVQRFGVQPLIVTGTVLVGAANLWLSGIDQSSTYAVHLLGPMILTGIGAGLTFMPITVAVLSDVEPRHAGSASGLLQMGQQIGGSLGLAVLVTVYASHASPGNVVAGMQQSFEAGALFLALALVVALVMLRRPRGAQPEGAVEDVELELAA